MDLREHSPHQFLHHIRSSIIEKLCALAQGPQNALASIIAHAAKICEQTLHLTFSYIYSNMVYSSSSTLTCQLQFPIYCTNPDDVDVSPIASATVSDYDY